MVVCVPLSEIFWDSGMLPGYGLHETQVWFSVEPLTWFVACLCGPAIRPLVSGSPSVRKASQYPDCKISSSSRHSSNMFYFRVSEGKFCICYFFRREMGLSSDLHSLGQYGSTQLVGGDCQARFKAAASAHYVIMEPAEVITNVTFPVHCRAEGRGFFFFFTRLAFCWSTTIWIPDGFLSRCCPVEAYCCFTMNLMKTWHPSRLGSVLWCSQLMCTDWSASFHLEMAWGLLGWEDFMWENKEAPLAESTGLGHESWGSERKGSW